MIVIHKLKIVFQTTNITAKHLIKAKVFTNFIIKHWHTLMFRNSYMILCLSLHRTKWMQDRSAQEACTLFSSGLLGPPCGFMSRPSLVWGGAELQPLVLGEADKGVKKSQQNGRRVSRWVVSYLSVFCKYWGRSFSTTWEESRNSGYWWILVIIRIHTNTMYTATVTDMLHCFWD